MPVRPKHDRSLVPQPDDIPLSQRQRFSFPHEVIDEPSLSLAQKRAILAEWASDQSAIESYPTLRQLRGTTFPVTFASVMDARQELDRMAIADDENRSDKDQLGRLIAANFARSRGRGGENSPQ